MNVPQDLTGRLQRAAQYVLGRQCRVGGFCVYRNDDLEEPNLADTWHALAALRLLGIDIPRLQDVDGWLEEFCIGELHVDGLHDWFFAKQAINADWHPQPRFVELVDALALEPPSQDKEYRGAFNRLIKAVRLKAACSVSCSSPRVVAWIQRLRHGGYGDTSNLQDTASALELLCALGNPDASEETRGFVNALQSPYLGFNNTRDSRYCRLETVSAGLYCCRQLDVPIQYGQTILSIVMAAQRPDGAIADSPGALPTLESHHTAIGVIKTLLPSYVERGPA